MQIYTSSWFETLPQNIFRIGVSRRQPRYKPKISEYPALAPGPWFNSVDHLAFCDLYAQQLRALDSQSVIEDLATLSAGKNAALLCFEPPSPSAPWCHRALVSAWLSDELGLEVYEFGCESEGCGWAHPKLPSQFRKSPQTG